MAYYGDPEVVRRYCRNLGTMASSPEWETHLALADAESSLVVEADLAPIYEAVPAPNSTMRDAASLLWLYETVGVIQQMETMATRVRQEGTVDPFEKRYERVLQRLQNGEIMIPGAIRRKGANPSIRILKGYRFLPDKGVTADEIRTVFQRNLRGMGASGADPLRKV